MGAADYLIKSDITPAPLTELLVPLNGKWQTTEQESEGLVHKSPHGYSLGLSHLKENLFKDMISGFINEQDVVWKKVISSKRNKKQITDKLLVPHRTTGVCLFDLQIFILIQTLRTPPS